MKHMNAQLCVEIKYTFTFGIAFGSSPANARHSLNAVEAKNAINYQLLI